MARDPTDAAVVVGDLRGEDLPEARRIVRVAFGTFMGAPDPENFWPDRDYVYGRHGAGHVAAFGAKLDGKLVGSNFATRWGSVGFFGPLSVRPDLQERGVAQRLLARTVEQFDAWGTPFAGLFTFPHSAKHIGLYQKFGFYARFLTAIMLAPAVERNASGWSRFSELTPAGRDEALRGCREMAETVYPGLDLSGEIAAAQAQGLGDTVIVEDSSGVAAFAVCQYGPRSEAGADNCYIKFGAVRADAAAEKNFLRLLDACESLAARVGMAHVQAGASMARHEAYRQMIGRGYRTAFQGVGMHRHNDPGYCCPGVYAIDDWR